MMRAQLRKIEPLKSVARIIDLNFQQLEQIRIRLEEVMSAVSASETAFSTADREDRDAVRAAFGSIAEQLSALLSDCGPIRQALGGISQSLLAHEHRLHSLSTATEAFPAAIAAIEERLASLSAAIEAVPAALETVGQRVAVLSATCEVHSAALETIGQRVGFLSSIYEDHRTRHSTLEESLASLASVSDAHSARHATLEHSLASLSLAAQLLSDPAFSASIGAAVAVHSRNWTELSDAIAQRVTAQLKPAVTIGREDFDLLNPEISLLQYLYSLIPNRVALDIGANVGEVSKRLVEAGYTVYAFEPYPPVFSELVKRMGATADFHAFEIAVGPNDARMDLHIATDTSSDGKHPDTSLYSTLVQHSTLDDLPFTGSVEVAVRSIESLQRAGLIPGEIGLAKIDAEGFDLEVVRGMGATRPFVVMTEFWDTEMVFGKSGSRNSLHELASEMRSRGYHWFIVIYRVGNQPVSFYCNRPRSVSLSWGNILFFRDRQVFGEARHWCVDTLPQTYY